MILDKQTANYGRGMSCRQAQLPSGRLPLEAQWPGHTSSSNASAAISHQHPTHPPRQVSGNIGVKNSSCCNSTAHGCARSHHPLFQQPHLNLQRIAALIRARIASLPSCPLKRFEGTHAKNKLSAGSCLHFYIDSWSVCIANAYPAHAADHCITKFFSAPRPTLVLSHGNCHANNRQCWRLAPEGLRVQKANLHRDCRNRLSTRTRAPTTTGAAVADSQIAPDTNVHEPVAPIVGSAPGPFLPDLPPPVLQPLPQTTVPAKSKSPAR